MKLQAYQHFLNMKYSESFIIKNLDNKLFIRSWIPEFPPKKNILVVHGLGEHSGRYKNFAEIFVKNGFGVFALDLIGHGKSFGKKGHLKKFVNYLDSIEASLIYIRKKYLNTPIILFGHSLGGLVSLKFLIDRESKEIDKSIISSPWIETAIKIPSYLLLIHKVLHKIFPSLQLHNNLVTQHLSKDQNVIDNYENDPLVHDRISLNLFSEIIKTIDNVIKKSSRIKLETLLYHGENDKIISHKGTKKIASLIPNNKFILFEDIYHEPHNDNEKDLVFKKMIEFINKQ